MASVEACLALAMLTLILILILYHNYEYGADADGNIRLDRFTSYEDKSNTIYDWFKQNFNKGVTFTQYQDLLGKDSNIAEYNEVYALTKSGGLDKAKVEAILQS